MSMPAVHDDELPTVDPDELKMPESSTHRRVIDVIGLAASDALDPPYQIFRDMNWYPIDGKGPVAPDVMVLPDGAAGTAPRSYHQRSGDDPPATVVVEVPSTSDDVLSFRAKAFRYQSLGTVVYLVLTDPPRPAVLRLGLDDDEPVAWTNRPIDELGGIRISAAGEQLAVITPSGLRARSDQELLQQTRAEADARLAELEERLRSLGVDPD